MKKNIVSFLNLFFSVLAFSQDEPIHFTHKLSYSLNESSSMITYKNIQVDEQEEINLGN